MLNSEHSFYTSTALRALYEKKTYKYTMIPQHSTYMGSDLYGYYMSGSKLTPQELDGITIGQLIASENWYEEYQCGLYVADDFMHDAVIEIENLGTYSLTYREDYRYISFEIQDCKTVARYFKQNLGKPIRLNISLIYDT